MCTVARCLGENVCRLCVCVCLSVYCVLRLVIRPQSAHLLLSFYACIYETNTLTHGQIHQQHKCTWVPRTIACTCNSHASMRDVAGTTASMLLLLRLSCIQRKIAMLRSCVKHVGSSHAHLLHVCICTTCVGCTRVSCKIECACMLSVVCLESTDLVTPNCIYLFALLVSLVIDDIIFDRLSCILRIFVRVI